MKRLLILIFVVAWMGGSVARADLDSDVKAVLQDKLLARADVGIELIRLGKTAADSAVLYKHNSDLPLMPASNLKLLTTSAALDRLGPDFKFRTRLILDHRTNDLIIVGDGDPTLGDVEMLRKVGWNVTTVFKTWAEELKKRNITVLHNLVVDDSVFDQVFFHPHWPTGNELERYSAQVGGINLNANCVDFTFQATGAGQAVTYALNPATHYLDLKNTCVTGSKNAVWFTRQSGTNEVIIRGETAVSTDVPVSVTVQDPAMFAGTVLGETIGGEGIRFTGGVVRDLTAYANLAKQQGQQTWQLLAVHETPIAAVIARANKDSMNLYAEALCKRLGREVKGTAGSWENGTAAVAEFLKTAGVPDGEYRLDDGCGLSREDGISANCVLRVLTYDRFSKNAEMFIASLSVAGTDGTLSDRFAGSDLRGRVLGKSGFINGVSALSGFLKGKDENWYAFSILMNGIPAKSNSSAKALQERIVRALDGQVVRPAVASDR